MSFLAKENHTKMAVKRYFYLDEFDKDKCAFKKFRGNLKFQSKFVFEGHSLSRRDDIVSLVYVLAYMNNPKILRCQLSDAKSTFEHYREVKC